MNCGAPVPPRFSLVALKIAWRELRASSVKFAFVVLAVAMGVGSLTGVRGFSESFRGTLLRKARTLMAADLTVRDFLLPSTQQQIEIDSLLKRGARLTRITETLTMLASPNKPEPLMVSVKAVDPRAYPFYGEVKLRPPAPLSTVLNAGTVAVAEDVLIRLHAQVGDAVRLGGKDFRIAAAVLAEPDRMSGSLNLGLRVLMTRDGLDRTGLIRPGSRAAQRYLFQLPPGSPRVEIAQAELKKAFPEAQVIDYRETNPSIAKSLERATTFLSLVTLVALIVGALGVSTAMHAHVQQKLDGIAIMKSLGARSSQVIGIYALQTLILGASGALLGICAGLGIQAIFPHLIERYFQIKTEFVVGWTTLGQGMAVGLLSTLLFTLPPLLRIRRIRPGVMLRREMAEAKVPWYRQWKQSREAVLVGLVILAGLGLIAAWLAESLQMGLFFVGGLLASLLVLAIVAWLLLRGLRLFLRLSRGRLPSTLRHGIANLYRPGNQATPVLVSLGIGVMFTLTIYLVQNSILDQIVETAPPGMPNVFLIDIQPDQKDGVARIVQLQQGLESKLDVVPSVQARLTKVNGTPVENLKFEGFSRRFLRTRSVTQAASQPAGIEIAKGSWWKSGDASPLIAVTEDAARVLKVQPGSVLDFLATDQPLHARVAAVYRTEGFRMGGMSEFTFTPETLRGLPAIFFAGVRIKPENVAAVQRAVYEKYPTVTVINFADALAIVQEVVDQIALVIRFLSAFAILAGVIVLASSVAGTRFRRVRETVILKTLGGTRRKIAGIFSVEFLILGAVAGLMGGLLATGFTGILIKQMMEGVPHYSVLPILFAVPATALIANAAGWLASFRILSQKPLEVLREE